MLLRLQRAQHNAPEDGDGGPQPPLKGGDASRGGVTDRVPLAAACGRCAAAARGASGGAEVAAAPLLGAEPFWGGTAAGCADASRRSDAPHVARHTVACCARWTNKHCSEVKHA